MGEYIAGIESTAHTFGVSIVSVSGEILSNEKKCYTTESGGLIPAEIRKHHKKFSGRVYLDSLKKSGIQEREIVAVAVSNAPGLAPCLLEGKEFAVRLARRLGVLIIGVNHCVAHLEIGEKEGAKDPVLLYASGANTQVIAYEAGKYRVFGETLDIGVGNFIDKFARFIGLGFPGGPKIEEASNRFRGHEMLELAYSVKGMDVSFSGLETQLKRLYLKGESVEKLSYSLQETAFAMLIEVSERALAHTGKNELLLGGGVACNSRLQEMAKIMCAQRKAKFFCPKKEYLVDNAAMIGYLGAKMLRAGIGTKDYESFDIFPRQRTDDVEVVWK